jgi:hypothetical protein
MAKRERDMQVRWERVAIAGVGQVKMVVSGEQPDTRAAQPRPKIGLVLEGGAKGAFQFGCLYALHEEGIEIDAVAGTSVGGLNAALWSTEQMEWGLQFWRSISFDKVYPLRKPLILFLPLSFLYAVLKAVQEWLAVRQHARYLAGMTQVWAGCMMVVLVLAALLAVVISILTGLSNATPYLGKLSQSAWRYCFLLSL